MRAGVTAPGLRTDRAGVTATESGVVSPRRAHQPGVFPRRREGFPVWRHDATGVIAYTREIAARTEAYWCPIKHQRRRETSAHRLYPEFVDFGDARADERGPVPIVVDWRGRRGAHCSGPDK
jgi:hypothetical protein